MELILNIILYIIAIVFTIGGIWSVGQECFERRLFKYDKYHVSRTCKRCGSTQNKYARPWDLSSCWWEEVYPIGNNPNCICHNFAIQYDV